MSDLNGTEESERCVTCGRVRPGILAGTCLECEGTLRSLKRENREAEKIGDLGDTFKALESAAQAHRETCTKKFCQACAKVPCDRCEREVATLGPVCASCRDEIGKERWNELVPEKYREARLDAGWYVEKVGFPIAAQLGRPKRLTRCMTLLGFTGAGKTASAVGLLRRHAKAFRSSMFVESFELGPCRHDQRMGKGTPKILREAKAAEILVLDDLMQEAPMFASVIVEVLLYRFSHGGITIVTYGGKRQALLDRYGAGVARRVFGMEPDGQEWDVVVIGKEPA